MCVCLPIAHLTCFLTGYYHLLLFTLNYSCCACVCVCVISHNCGCCFPHTLSLSFTAFGRHFTLLAFRLARHTARLSFCGCTLIKHTKTTTTTCYWPFLNCLTRSCTHTKFPNPLFKPFFKMLQNSTSKNFIPGSLLHQLLQISSNNSGTAAVHSQPPPPFPPPQTQLQWAVAAAQLLSPHFRLPRLLR